MVLFLGWKVDCLLLDFMCGLGMLVIEVGLIVIQWVLQFNWEYFGFKCWLDFDEVLWV